MGARGPGVRTRRAAPAHPRLLTLSVRSAAPPLQTPDASFALSLPSVPVLGAQALSGPPQVPPSLYPVSAVRVLPLPEEP